MTEFISPFGPMIMHSKLSDECFNILRANANDSRKEDLDFRQFMEDLDFLSDIYRRFRFSFR